MQGVQNMIIIKQNKNTRHSSNSNKGEDKKATYTDGAKLLSLLCELRSFLMYVEIRIGMAGDHPIPIMYTQNIFESQTDG